eukprot:14356298-Alexandrium_andersonii.AAC.1
MALGGALEGALAVATAPTPGGTLAGGSLDGTSLGADAAAPSRKKAGVNREATATVRASSRALAASA